MARAAGKKSNYTWVLKNESTNKYDTSSVISMPSVTTIIGAVLNKPFLVQWAYAQTRDVISGLVSVMEKAQVYDHADVMEMLTDADILEEVLKENKIRPTDLRDERAEEGTEAHACLEELARIHLEEGAADAIGAAHNIASHPDANGYEKATADWWVARTPQVVASELVLYSLTHRFSGTVDLIWRDEFGDLTVTDLKSRRKDLGMYDSDDIQTAAYVLGYEEMTGEQVAQRTILLIHDDGTWKEEVCRLPAEAFLHLRALYEMMKGD